MINNLAGATLEVQGETDFAHNFGSPGSAFNNAGLFRKTGGGETRFSSAFITFRNTGSTVVENGSIMLQADGPLGGAISLLAGTNLRLSGASYTIEPGLTLDGTGQLIFDSGTLTADTGISLPNYTQNGGTLRGAGTVTVTGAFSWTGGVMRDAGKTLVAAGAAGSLSGGNNKDLASGRILENAGSFTVSGGTVFFNRDNFGGGAVINNLAGATLEVQGETDFAHNFASPGSAFNNAGLFRKTGGGETRLSVNVALNNTGTVQLISSALRTEGAFEQLGRLTGSGTINASFTNKGILRPDPLPGGINVTGNFVQTAAGRMELTLALAETTLQHRSFRVAGTVFLDGTLDIALVSPFAEPLNATFPVLSFGTRSGDFASATGLTGNFGYDFSRSFGSTALNLTVLTEGALPPPPAGIMAAGFDQWMNQQAVAAGASGLSGRDEDADGDGVSNFEEYAFGTPPFQAGPALQLVASTTQESGLTWAVLEFPRRTDTSALQYQIIGSNDLGDWSPVSDTVELSRSPVPGKPGLEMVRLAVWPALDPEAPRFLKVQVLERFPAMPVPKSTGAPKPAKPRPRR